MHRMLLHALPGVLLAASLCNSVRAENLPCWHARAAAVEAHTIVVARPLNDKSLPAFEGQNSPPIGEFVVEEVLRGDKALVSQTLQVNHQDLFVRKDPFSREAKQAEIKSALLFLQKKKEESWGLNYVYVQVSDGRVMRPAQARNPGPYVLRDGSSTSWEEIKGIVRSFLPQEAALLALHDIPDAAERNRRLFGWIRAHEGEFEPLFTPYRQQEEPRTGWGILQHRVFDWIEEAGIPVDSWLAMQLHADVMGYPCKRWPASDSPSRLAHVEGRAFLLKKLLDDSQPLVARRTAASCLSRSLNPGCLATQNPRFVAVSLVEQEGLIRAVLPLAYHDDAFLRREVLLLLLNASDPFNDANRPQRTELAHADLAAALMKETEPDILDGLPEKLNHLMDEAAWKKVTGNERRVLVTQHVLMKRDKLSISARSVHLPHGANLPVEITLERLAEDGKVLETLIRSAGSKDGLPWPDAHDGLAILNDIQIPNMQPGLWRIRLKGTGADDQRLPWTSWHTCLRVP